MHDLLPSSEMMARLRKLPTDQRLTAIRLLEEKAARLKADIIARAGIDGVLSEKQAEQLALVEGPARHVLAYGGARSGKTFGFCYPIAKRALSAPGSRHLIARLHNIDVRQAVMMDTWPKMMRTAFPGIRYKINRADQYAQFENGAEVWFGGLDDKERVEKILGKEYATIYPNETSQIAYATILTLRTRLAQNCKTDDGQPLPLKMLYDLNPVGTSHWTFKEFQEHKRPDNGLPVEPGSREFVVINPVDNPHLPPEYIDELNSLPDRQRQRYFEGRYQTEAPGTLWPLDRIDAYRVAARPDLERVVVAVDPSGSDGIGGDMQGIITVGLGVDGHAYVLRDSSCRLSPEGWARRAVRDYAEEKADVLLGEINFGGAMVESTIRAVDRSVNFKKITVSRGKHLRAEPVAALYEKGVVHHVCPPGASNPFAALEEQMGMMTTQGFEGSGSPDRVDALVMALSELMLEQFSNAGFYAMIKKDLAEKDAKKAAAAAEVLAPNPANPGVKPIACPYPPGSVEYEQFIASA